ncbi:MAG: hypothetical protein ABR584_08005 [Candidatus Baltobacteraceae bacterium]
MNGMQAFKIAALSATVAMTPSPPGTMTQYTTAHMAGAAPHSTYEVAVSRVAMGKALQMYLSVYAPAAGGKFRQIYLSPSAMDGYALIPKVEQGHGTPSYFPHETLDIVGTGELMGEARDQAVVLLHAQAADCGETTLSVLSLEDGAVTVPVQVSNLCGLSASIKHHTIVLRGPYYNAAAPAYKPTKNNATATLRYVDAHWVERPQYFKLNYPKEAAASHPPVQTPTPMFTPIFKAILGTPVPSGGAPATPRPQL